MLTTARSGLLFVVVLSAACGGSPQPSNGGADTTAGSNAGTLGDTSGSTCGSTAGGQSGTSTQTCSCSHGDWHGPSGISARCDAEDSLVRPQLEAALAAADRSCTTDDDCVFYDPEPYCAISCFGSGAPISTAAAAVLEAAVSELETTSCTPDCHEIFGPCGLRPRWAACLGGACENFPPANAWRVIELLSKTQEAGSLGPYDCTDAPCSKWTLTADGQLTVVRDGVSAKPSMAPADLSTIRDILTGMAFRAAFRGYPELDCSGDRTAEPQLTFMLDLTMFVTAMNVTGCAFAEPGLENALATIESILMAY